MGSYNTETKDAIRIAVWLQMSADLGIRRRRVVLARRRERPSGTPQGTPWGAARASATSALAVRASAPAAVRGLTARYGADCQLPTPAVVRAVCHRAWSTDSTVLKGPSCLQPTASSHRLASSS